MVQIANIDYSEYNKGMAGLIRHTGKSSVVVIKKEAAELIKTLVKVTPPSEFSAKSKSQQQVKSNIDRDVNSKFEMAAHGGYRDFDSTSGNIGASGVKWYSVDERYLRGVLPQNDLTKAPDAEVYKAMRAVNKKGRIITQFKHPRTRQRVMISQKILVTKNQIVRAATRLKKNVGRLKAGWLVAVARQIVTLSGGNMPPEWVNRHKFGAKGDAINGLNNDKVPYLVISNSATGISKTGAAKLAQTAVTIRAKAMAANLKLMMSGKKRLADYATA